MLHRSETLADRLETSDHAGGASAEMTQGASILSDSSDPVSCVTAVFFTRRAQAEGTQREHGPVL